MKDVTENKVNFNKLKERSVKGIHLDCCSKLSNYDFLPISIAAGTTCQVFLAIDP